MYEQEPPRQTKHRRCFTPAPTFLLLSTQWQTRRLNMLPDHFPRRPWQGDRASPWNTRGKFWTDPSRRGVKTSRKRSHVWKPLFTRGDARRQRKNFGWKARASTHLKSDGGVRPVTVGEKLRRFISSVMMRRVEEKERQLLQPRKVGVATSGGFEAIIHESRRLIKNWATTATTAFYRFIWRTNSTLWTGMNSTLLRVRTSPRSRLGWTTSTKYRTRTCVRRSAKCAAYCVLGVQNGDPLGPLLFALALHELLQKLSANLASQPGDRGEIRFFDFYLDDGVDVGKHEALD